MRLVSAVPCQEGLVIGLPPPIGVGRNNGKRSSYTKGHGHGSKSCKEAELRSFEFEVSVDGESKTFISMRTNPVLRRFKFAAKRLGTSRKGVRKARWKSQKSDSVTE